MATQNGGYVYRSSLSLVRENRRLMDEREKRPKSLAEIRARVAQTTPTISSTQVKEVFGLLENPRHSLHSTYSGTVRAVRRYLMYDLNVNAAELDNIMLSFFVEHHLDEIETADSDGSHV